MINRIESITMIKFLFVLICLLSSSPVWATTYWAHPSGTATNKINCAGETDPGGGGVNLSKYCTIKGYYGIGRSVNTLAAGDTVKLMPGTYTSATDWGIKPLQSGTSAEAMITFDAADSEDKPVLYFTGSVYAILLSGISYVAVKNMVMTYNGIIVRSGAHHLEISYNEVSGATRSINISGQCGSTSVYTCSVTHVWVHHNIFHTNGNIGAAPSCDDGGGNIYPLGSSMTGDNTGWITFEDNLIYHGGHHNLETNGTNMIIRRNTFYNNGFLVQSGCTYPASPRNDKYGNRPIQIYDGRNRDGVWNLIESNRVGHQANASDGGVEGNIVITAPKNIVRYNYSYYAEQAGIYLKTGGSSYSVNNRIYNNTLFYNGQDSSLAISGIEIRYGIVLKTGSGYGGNVVKNNLMSGNYIGDYACGYPGCADINTITNNFLDATGDPLFANTTVSDPTSQSLFSGHTGYAATALPDLSLGALSPAKDGGTYLTTTVGSDTDGVNLFVVDALYFQDGTWGSSLSSISGDWIVIGEDPSQATPVQISSILYSFTPYPKIVLATPYTWATGAKVWLYKKSDGVRVLYGAAPEYGAYEISEEDVDTTAPVLTNLIPTTGSIQPCTTDPASIQLGVSTSEAATCKYSTTETVYASMGSTFTTTGATSHSETLSLACGAAYTYNVACTDGTNTSDASTTTFNIQATISNVSVNISVGEGSNTITRPGDQSISWGEP